VPPRSGPADTTATPPRWLRRTRQALTDKFITVIRATVKGGMAVFGIDGFVLGPAIAAMFIAVRHFYATTRFGATP